MSSNEIKQTNESNVQKQLQNLSEVATFFGGTSAFYGIGASKIKC